MFRNDLAVRSKKTTDAGIVVAVLVADYLCGHLIWPNYFGQTVFRQHTLRAFTNPTELAFITPLFCWNTGGWYIRDAAVMARQDARQLNPDILYTMDLHCSHKGYKYDGRCDKSPLQLPILSGLPAV